jgi:pimeloyl-[acyl-carrier protein] synthase
MTARSGFMSSERTHRRLGLYQLLDPAVAADPYPLYRRLRDDDPVLWDPFLRAWVVTRYDDVMTVVHRSSANRAPTPDQLEALGLKALAPVARVMVRQMLFMDPPEHARVRALTAKCFNPRRVEQLREHVADIIRQLLDRVQIRGVTDLIADLALPLPAIVSSEMLGLPSENWPQLTSWTRSLAELLGNFQHNPTRTVRAVDDMTAYFRNAIHTQSRHSEDGLLHALVTAENAGDRFTEEEVIANAIITLVGGLETTTHLIGNGMLALLLHPEQWHILRADPTLVPGAVEELLRFESPIQHTARLAPDDDELGGRRIRKRQAVIAVLAAANRDPQRFPEPDRLDIRPGDNRHLAFGWASHHCFGAPLARLQGELAFSALVERMGSARLTESVRWRRNAGAFRGPESLPIEF